ncbi:MAG: hypothetical protein KDC67_13320 [Ignavibacteriae bacterium]|nr:hypothetical protein [Ignavibacteriota bacterium]MCB0748416.1 hypothetical protein [Ignavibacteriota bacterium]
MKHNYDELINKYLDNELSNAELESVNVLLKSDNEFKTKFATQKYVHENLYELPVHEAPIDISEKIMSKLVSKLKSKYQKNYFFRGVITVLSIVLITVLFMFFFYLNDLKFIQDAPSATNYIKNYTRPAFAFISKLIASEIFRTVSGIVGFIILLSFYFVLNSYKDFKDRINHF